MNESIIEVKDLKINIKIDEGTLTAVRGVDFEIKKQLEAARKILEDLRESL